MVLRWFVIYAVVELAVVVALSSAIGFGWTVLLLLATFALGLALAGSQLKRQLRRLRAGLDDLHGAVTDSMLVALGTALVVVPGLVTTVLGVLLLVPVTRAAVRPGFSALAARRVPLITIVSTPGTGYAARGDYIDGEVVDVTDIEPAALPHRPD